MRFRYVIKCGIRGGNKEQRRDISQFSKLREENKGKDMSLYLIRRVPIHIEGEQPRVVQAHADEIEFGKGVHQFKNSIADKAFANEPLEVKRNISVSAEITSPNGSSR